MPATASVGLTLLIAWAVRTFAKVADALTAPDSWTHAVGVTTATLLMWFGTGATPATTVASWDLMTRWVMPFRIDQQWVAPHRVGPFLITAM